METANPSSLLVTEAEENGVPALGGTDSGGMGHQMELSDDFQSPLERLIAQSTSEQRGDSFSVGSTQHLENPLATDTPENNINTVVIATNKPRDSGSI